MEHLEIAYDLGVIMIGFATLSITSLWALKSRETYLCDFCILYGLFTAVMLITVLDKYLSINIQNYTSRTWFAISAIKQVVNFAVNATSVQVFLELYQIQERRKILTGIAAAMVVGLGLMFSPIGAVLDENQRAIQLGSGYHIASAWYMASFTFALTLGYGLFGRVWRSNQRIFVLGLLIFATIGYAESLNSFIHTLRNPVVFQTSQADFLYSSIPYALYGVFLMVYFSRYAQPAQLVAHVDELPENFLAKYGITEREREIIQKVIQGKSNADIASELYISLATVKTHLHNIYTKIGADSRYDLLARIRSGQ